MAYLTATELKAYEKIGARFGAMKTLQDSVGLKIFLSHSHYDREYVQAARGLFESYDATVYVDWEDGEMPTATGPATAKRLMAKIDECDRFVVLASERSVNSAWVPWELGYAEGKKGNRPIAILPFIATNGWRGAEYFGLYQTIETGQTVIGNHERVGVLMAGSTMGYTLDFWLGPHWSAL